METQAIRLPENCTVERLMKFLMAIPLDYTVMHDAGFSGEHPLTEVFIDHVHREVFFR